MIYTYAAILIVILVLIFLIIRWWNLPKVIEERRESAEAAQKRRFERWNRWFGRRRVVPKPPEKPELKPAPVDPTPSDPAPNEGDALLKPLPEINPSEPRERRRWFPRLWRKK